MSSREWLPQAAFQEVRRGYSPAQVNEYLDRLEYDLRILTADRDEANYRLSEVTAQLQAAQSESEDFRLQLDRIALAPTSMAGLSERMQRMIRLAEEEASEVRARSHTEAAEQQDGLDRDRTALADERLAFERERKEARAQLAQQVRKTLTSAAAESEQVRGQAADSAAATVGQAQTESAQLLGSSREEAERLLTEARAEADKVLGQAAEAAHATAASARQHHTAVTTEAQQIGEHAAAERVRLDAEADARRKSIDEDFAIAIASRRTQAHQYVIHQEHESRAQAEELVASATAQAQQIVTDATTEANRRVSYAAQESHRRVTEAERAVDATFEIRRQVLSQLAGLQPYLGQIQQAVTSSTELLGEAPAETDKADTSTFDPQVPDIDFGDGRAPQPGPLPTEPDAVQAPVQAPVVATVDDGEDSVPDEQYASALPGAKAGRRK